MGFDGHHHADEEARHRHDAERRVAAD
jgi:hypothetical protein